MAKFILFARTLARYPEPNLRCWDSPRYRRYSQTVRSIYVGNYDGTRLRFARKKDGEEAIVPIRQAARDHIQAYLERRRAAREVLTDESPLFLSYDFHNSGKGLGYQGIYHFAKNRLGEATGIENLTPHRFRHTYASELVELGIDSLLARTLTGHRSEKVFERYIQGKQLAAAESAFYQALGEKVPDSKQQNPED